mmetsp:Transcript_10765/g.27702  ORF Transcript_10765/g.27702 Transcript_10765/m.27702 type:complete len:201 (+) Transcript_10765:1491-2093(+)
MLDRGAGVSAVTSTAGSVEAAVAIAVSRESCTATTGTFEISSTTPSASPSSSSSDDEYPSENILCLLKGNCCTLASEVASARTSSTSFMLGTRWSCAAAAAIEAGSPPPLFVPSPSPSPSSSLSSSLSSSSDESSESILSSSCCEYVGRDFVSWLSSLVWPPWATLPSFSRVSWLCKAGTVVLAPLSLSPALLSALLSSF